MIANAVREVRAELVKLLISPTKGLLSGPAIEKHSDADYGAGVLERLFRRLKQGFFKELKDLLLASVVETIRVLQAPSYEESVLDLEAVA